MPHLFIFGLGYTAGRLARRLRDEGWHIDATGREGNIAFDDADAVARALAGASHVLSSVPPDREGVDPVLDRYGKLLSHEWIGYLSSTGVYGDTSGAWVDESASIGTGRRRARARSDALWQETGAHVFRLPGIYGPERSALERVREGKAHRIDLPMQVFSRIHVDDIVSGVVAGMDGPPGTYNLADDRPASQNEVIEEACRLLDRDPPPLQSLDDSGLSPMAREFYAENRRVANVKAKRILGWRPFYRDFRVGLAAIAAGTP